MEGISRITLKLIFAAVFTLGLIHSASGVRCYSCGGGATTCKASPEDWMEIDCSQTGFPTCVTYYNGGNNITRGCGTVPASKAEQSHQKLWKFLCLSLPSLTGTTKSCHCGGDLCNFSEDGYGLEQLCNVCGGSSGKPCPSESELNSTEVVTCSDGVVGYRRESGVCQTIRDRNCHVTSLGCVNKFDKTAENLGCKKEKGSTVCYCDFGMVSLIDPRRYEQGCNSVVKEECTVDPNTNEDSDGSENVTASASVASLSLLQLVLLPLINFMAETASTGY